MISKITIIRTRRETANNVNAELQYIGNSLGLFSLRDKNSSAFRIFIILLKRSKIPRHISSDEIAERLGLTRGTVVHHLNMLMNAGLVIREHNSYILRENNLERLIEEIKRDIDNTFNNLIKIAREVDQKL